MSKNSGPELTIYLEKRLKVKLNAKREVQGVLRGYDQFMNIVLEDAYECNDGKPVNAVGTVVIDQCWIKVGLVWFGLVWLGWGCVCCVRVVCKTPEVEGAIPLRPGHLNERESN
eukprot:TRINITY_DN66482_c1_g1_i2.p1 TRINITY_DN66482_c1_g1~~TRINITY_DN66482_c1_g1_i2.p1  ORF type:complete len:114 (-),score=27.55 TRINITY_DN66482_c1_g1_i2:70-411(-)